MTQIYTCQECGEAIASEFPRDFCNNYCRDKHNAKQGKGASFLEDVRI